VKRGNLPQKKRKRGKTMEKGEKEGNRVEKERKKMEKGVRGIHREKEDIFF
jgi:hypothetical protein